MVVVLAITKPSALSPLPVLGHFPSPHSPSHYLALAAAAAFSLLFFVAVQLLALSLIEIPRTALFLLLFLAVDFNFVVFLFSIRVCFPPASLRAWVHNLFQERLSHLWE